MFEFNGWAVVEADGGGEAADHALMARLKEHVAEGKEEMPRGFHFEEGLNGFRSVLMSGMRNHPRPEVVGVFYWLAAESRRAYGLLYVRNDEVDDPADVNRWRVWRLADGEVTYHEDTLFG